MNSRLTIQDLAGLLAERTGKDKASAELFLKEFIAVVSQGVFTDKIVKVKGLGTFKVVLVEKRESIHVNTGERFLIPAHYKFSFLPDKELRELVNKPFSFFETTELNENVDFKELDVLTEVEDEKETEDESVEELIPEIQEKVEEKAEEKTEEKVEVVEQIISETEMLEPKEIVQPEELSKELPEDASEEVPEVKEEPLSNESQEAETEEIPESPQEDIIEEKLPEEPVAEPQEAPQASSLSNNFPDTDFQFEDEEPTLSPWVKRLVIIGILLLVAGGSTFLYIHRSFFLGPDIPSPALTGRSLPETPVTPLDTIPEEKDGLNEADTLANDTVVVEPVAPAPPVTEQPASTPEVIAKVKIETGSRLTLISLEYYGSKIFWVYLYEYNKAVIKDPNNIPVGTEILVPAPAVYGIDKHSRASVEKAAARQTEILSGNL